MHLWVLILVCSNFGPECAWDGHVEHIAGGAVAYHKQATCDRKAKDWNRRNKLRGGLKQLCVKTRDGDAIQPPAAPSGDLSGQSAAG